jgi:hypothetical protein
MVIINDNGVNISFPSEYSEITVQQLDKIAEVFELDITETEQWILIVSYLACIPKETVEEWPMDDFIQICKQMFVRLPEPGQNLTSVTLDGYTYTITPYDYLTARESAMIEKIFSRNNSKRLAQVLAVIFKRDDLSKTEHFANAHIKYKAELFGKLMADTMIGNLGKFGIEFLENLVETINEDTNVTGDIES